MNQQDEENFELPQVEPPKDQPINDSPIVPQSSQQPTTLPAQTTSASDIKTGQQQESIQQTSMTDPAMVAEDVDLIEKAWVDKAKDIVKGTVGDPHSQNEQMNQIKIDYMKKRYNRDVKAGE